MSLEIQRATFQVTTATFFNPEVFCDVAPFRLVHEDCLTLQTLGYFEKSVTIQSKWPHIPEDLNIRNCLFVQYLHKSLTTIGFNSNLKFISL
jgi:hypothetical protein